MTEFKQQEDSQKELSPSMRALEKQRARFMAIVGLDLSQPQVEVLGGPEVVDHVKTGWAKQVSADKQGFLKNDDETRALGGPTNLDKLARLVSFHENAGRMAKAEQKMADFKANKPREFYIASIVKGANLGDEDQEKVKTMFGFDDFDKAKLGVGEAWKKQDEQKGSIKSAEELMVFDGAARLDKTVKGVKEIMDAMDQKNPDGKPGLSVDDLSEDEKWILGLPSEHDKDNKPEDEAQVDGSSGVNPEGEGEGDDKAPEADPNAGGKPEGEGGPNPEDENPDGHETVVDMVDPDEDVPEEPEMPLAEGSETPPEPVAAPEPVAPPDAVEGAGTEGPAKQAAPEVAPPEPPKAEKPPSVWRRFTSWVGRIFGRGERASNVDNLLQEYRRLVDSSYLPTRPDGIDQRIAELKAKIPADRKADLDAIDNRDFKNS